MGSSSSTVQLGPLRLTPAAAGALCCAVSVLGYSAANACMNQLSRMSCVSTWAIGNKELVTVLAVGPWVLAQAWRGKSGFPRGRPLAILVAAGLATELIGNLGVQWGYQVVGMAVMVPAYTGFILVSSALLGRLLLGEKVSARNMAAIGLVILAVVLLGAGGGQGVPATAAKPPASPLAIAAAIAVAVAAGTVFALLGIAVRNCVTGTTSQSAVMVIITGMGVLSLGPLSFASAGAAKLLATPWQQYALMSAAGICNLIAFTALVRGLHLTTVLHVYMLNAGQVALAAVAGIVFFGEDANGRLVLGVVIMIAGIFAFGSPVDQEAIDAHV